MSRLYLPLILPLLPKAHEESGIHIAIGVMLLKTKSVHITPLFKTFQQLLPKFRVKVKILTVACRGLVIWSYGCRSGPIFYSPLTHIHTPWALVAFFKHIRQWPFYALYIYVPHYPDIHRAQSLFLLSSHLLAQRFSVRFSCQWGSTHWYKSLPPKPPQ